MGSNLMQCASMLRLLRSYLPRNDVLIEFLEVPINEDSSKTAKASVKITGKKILHFMIKFFYKDI